MMKKGFTLLELMITLAIFSIFSGYLYKIYFNQIKLFSSINNRNDFQYEAKTGEYYISREIRNNINDITYDSINKLIKKTSSGTILVNASGDVSNSVNMGNINFDATNHTFLSKSGDILCRYVNSISITHGNTNNGYNADILLIDIQFSNGKDNYSISTGINTTK